MFIFVKKSKMDNKKYTEQSAKTLSSSKDLNIGIDNNTIDLLHCAIGAVTESGELLDSFKKHIYYKKDLDIINIVEEIGDIQFYLFNLCRLLNLDMEDIYETNIKKLRARYGEKFSTEKANDRDLKTERTILEGNPLHALSKVVVKPRINTPPGTQDWKNTIDNKLDVSQKNVLLRQMRDLYQSGQNVNSNLPATISIDDFTEGFNYLENPKDYIGAFLVRVLKSEEDIVKESKAFNLDLTNEIIKCKKCNLILISVIDMHSSSLRNEEKKFILVLSFDKIKGEVSVMDFLFANKSNKTLSQRQNAELEKFCQVKQISR